VRQQLQFLFRTLSPVGRASGKASAKITVRVRRIGTGFPIKPVPIAGRFPLPPALQPDAIGTF